jgi:hypothetical protein
MLGVIGPAAHMEGILAGHAMTEAAAATQGVSVQRSVAMAEPAALPTMYNLLH